MKVLASGTMTSTKPFLEVRCSKWTFEVTSSMPMTSPRSSSQKEPVSPFS